MTDQEIVRAVAEEVIWKEIPDYPDYEVSNYGQVRSWKHKDGRRKKPWMLKFTVVRGYYGVQLTQNGQLKRKLVHDLILSTFVGPRPKGQEACHNDGDKTNNYYLNLRWDTRKNNHADKLKHGTQPQGSRHWNAKLDEEDVENIRLWRTIYGYTHKKLAELHDVSRSTIGRILNGVDWRHVC